jgi:hypothetical protein
VEFFSAMAKLIGAPTPKPVPYLVGRLLAGRHAARFSRIPIRTGNRRFKDATGWKPAYADITAGLDEVARAWRAEGFPPTGKQAKPKAEKAVRKSPRTGKA